MIEEKVEILMPDGISTGFLYRPENESPLPGILHMTDIYGVRPTSQAMGLSKKSRNWPQRPKRKPKAGFSSTPKAGLKGRFSSILRCKMLRFWFSCDFLDSPGEGFTVLLPNVFYRTGKPPLFDFVPDFKDERTPKRFAEVTGPLTPEAISRDVKVYLDFLSSCRFVRPGGIGVVGYCFTGAVALRMAATLPEKIHALVSFHGGGLYTDTPASPHLVLPQVKARLYFAHADQDASMPGPAIEKFNQALKNSGLDFESEIYPGALHGWTIPDRPAFNQLMAECAFEKMVAFFKSSLVL